MKAITKTIWLLSLVSLFTDISTEMLYPVMPIFLKHIGFSVLFIGVLEGIAEAVAGFGKGYFGKMSDSSGKRVPYVRFGYTLGAIAKPMMALVLSPLWILFARTLDRIGKGVRTGARDAMLSAETTPEMKGRVFGFHRSFDTIGAAVGPIFALIYLMLRPGDYIPLFYIAFLPGVVSIGLTFLLKDKEQNKVKSKTEYNLLAFLKYWRVATPEYKRLVIGLILFALFNSSDVFLLLIARHNGFSDTSVLSFYIFYNLVYAATSVPAGILGDKAGLKNMFVAGLCFFAVTYFLLPFAYNTVFAFALFFVYGLYAAATEGISKAWRSNIAAKNEVATAIGFYTSWQSAATLLASVIAGIMWNYVSPSSPFILTSTVTVVVIIYLANFVKPKR